MLRNKFNKEKIIITILCVIALMGFLFPAINIDVNFLITSRNVSFSMRTIFNRPDNPFGGADMSRLSEINILDVSGGIFDEVRTKLVTAISAYLITLIALIALLICTLVDKLKKTSAVISTVSFALFIYAGYAISTVTEPLIGAIENTLGLVTLFIDISSLISLSLGNGFWLTLIAIGVILAIKIVNLISKLISKNSKIKLGGVSVDY